MRVGWRWRIRTTESCIYIRGDQDLDRSRRLSVGLQLSYIGWTGGTQKTPPGLGIGAANFGQSWHIYGTYKAQRRL
jgi:hypothetical protein